MLGPTSVYYLGETHKYKSISLGVLYRITENVAVLHPRRDHGELVLAHRSPIEWENVGVVQSPPQQNFFAKPLRAVVSSPRDSEKSADEKTLTLVVSPLSSSGANLNALTATFLPFHGRFHRLVYPRVAKGIPS